MSFLPVDFHFLRPMWFLALVPGLILLLALLRKKGSGASLQQFCDPSLLPHLLLNGHVLRKRRNLPITLLVLTLLLTVVSLAGPTWERQSQPVFRVQMARVLVLDLSGSMAAKDVSPSRLSRAVFKLRDILERSREGRTGLVVFGGDAHVVVPLTDDVQTIKSMLSALQVDIVPVQGDLLAPALEQASLLFSRGNAATGEIVLLSDGIADVAASMAQLFAMREQGISLSVLALGTVHGAPVPGAEGEFETGKDGKTKIARLDSGPLEELARAGGGRFAQLTADDGDLDKILVEDGLHSLNRADGGEQQSVDLWREEGIYLVPVIILLASLGFRRGWLICLTLLVLLQSPSMVYAFWGESLFENANQRGEKALAVGEAEQAASLFSDPKWKGTAYYESGDYAAAAESFASIPGEEYNLGNALAREGRLEEAIKAYDSALVKDSNNDDARSNREIVEKLLQQKKQQDKQNQQQQQGEDSGEDQGDGDQQQGDADKQGKDGQDTAGEQEDREQGASEQEQTEKSDTEDADQVPEDQAKQEDVQGEEAAKSASQNQDVSDESEEPATGASMSDGIESEPLTEQEVALEQWLRQVPDDPSGLLRRKFMIEHLKRRKKR